VTQDDIEYEARKFTLPNGLALRLDTLAEEHYGGNVSQFLRSAIKDHARTLRGQDEFEFRKLRSEVQQVVQRVDEVVEAVEEDAQLRSENGHHQTGDSDGRAKQGAAVQRQVQKRLLASPMDSLTLDELVDRVDEDSLAVQSAIEALVEREYIERSDGSPAEYRIRPP
jgi:sugar-specific transcriptional regulator TrmB